MGWQTYKLKTENNQVFIKAAELEDEEPEKVLHIIEKELTKIKFACFGKVKLYSKDKKLKQLEALQEEKFSIVNNNNPDESQAIGVIDSNIAKVLKDIESDKYEKDINFLNNLKTTKGKSAAAFGLKNKVLGMKKGSQVQTILTDPDTGKEVNNPKDIKRVSLDYVVNLLTRKSSDDKYTDVINAKKQTHFKRMEEEVVDDLDELPFSNFQKTLETLRKKPGNKYDFITKAGQSLQIALFKLFQLVWKREKIPDKWQESTVIQLPKGKLFQTDLNFIRHIHDRDIYSKFFGQMVMLEAKPKLFENLSKYQIACKPGHRPSEHLFILKSVFEKYNKEKKGF